MLKITMLIIDQTGNLFVSSFNSMSDKTIRVKIEKKPW